MSASSRIGQYARLAAAPAVIAAAPVATADIVFDDSTTTLAADGNGVSSATFADGLVRMAHWSSILFTFPGGSYLASNLNAQGIYAQGIAGEPGAANGFLAASKLDAGDMISQGNVVTFGGAGSDIFGQLFFTNYNNPAYGNNANFEIGDSGFVGFSGTLDEGQVVYGWVAVSVGAGELTINGWAYDDAGGAIAAGQIPAPGAVGLLGLAAGAAGMRRKRTA